ncbi:MAG TPA: RHS repeat-associated core domain-containing protein, partial [Acidimicrobiales bacterium]|nr:RHS repeat-associated core domain-containing protein [Acidimicrobiales bacterium]
DTLASTTLASFNYQSPTARNADEEVTSETDTGAPGPSTTTYTYDPDSRLTSDGSSSYTYNNASQLSTGPGGSVQYFDPAGELCWSATTMPQGSSCTSPPSGASTYSYNALGERTGSSSGSSSTTYGWDQHGDLTSATTPSGTVGYTYNAAGLISNRAQGSSSANFVWDEVEDPSEPLLVYDGTNYYLYGPDGLPTEQISASTGTPAYFLHDQLGSTRLLTSSTGAVVGGWTYNAWGQTVATTGSATATPLLWAGQYQDPATGLYYMRARWYDPSTGEFLSVDPDFNSTLDAYGYADNNPVTNTDPSGLLIVDPGGGAGSACYYAPDQCPGPASSASGPGGGSTGSTAPTKVTTSFGYPPGTKPGESPGAIPVSLWEYDQSHHINYTQSQLRVTEVAFGEAYSAQRLYDLATLYAGEFRDDPALLAGAEQGLLHPAGWSTILSVALSLLSIIPAGIAADAVEEVVDDAISSTALARQLGSEGEDLAGIDQAAKVRIPSATGTAAYRIPDALTDTTLTEVKNVAKLSYTNQLRDFYNYASSTGRTFELVTRTNTVLSGPLEQMVNAGQIDLVPILPAR